VFPSGVSMTASAATVPGGLLQGMRAEPRLNDNSD
jgi:hypothetical protein